MIDMLQEIPKAFFLIFIAEMGDKTQILAMAFATRFPIRKVLLGIGIGSFLNHGLAVLLGTYLSKMIPINIIQMCAGAAFVGFALWTLKSDDEEETETKNQFGPVATVALAFFLGELGDKTQLTAITLAADATYPLMILTGTVLGMIATGALGIIVGKKLGDKIPELGIKLLAASIFMLFGLQKLWQTVPEQYVNSYIIVPFIGLLAFVVFLMVRNLFVKRRMGIQSEFMAKSKMLHDYYQHIQDDLDNICMGSEYCNACQGHKCAIGHAKKVIEKSLEEPEWQGKTTNLEFSYKGKPYFYEDILDSLVDTIWLIDNIKDEEKLNNAHIIRNQLETILLNKTISNVDNVISYIDEITKEDYELGKKIENMYKMRKPVEDRIINIGNKVSNIYLIAVQDGYLLIDTGYKEQYKHFEKELIKNQISFDDIAYILITHAHDDHVGFLNQLLDKTKAKVILHPEAVERLKYGQNDFNGGCSGLMAWSFCQFMKLFGKGEHRFDPVDSPERYIIVNQENKSEIERMLSGKIIELPGHTHDSIGLLFEHKILFCGDAAANGIPNIKHVIIWIENMDDYKTSWETMINLDFEMVYPSHGNPFAKEKLSKYQRKLSKIKLYPLG